MSGHSRCQAMVARDIRKVGVTRGAVMRTRANARHYGYGDPDLRVNSRLDDLPSNAFVPMAEVALARVAMRQF